MEEKHKRLPNELLAKVTDHALMHLMSGRMIKGDGILRRELYAIRSITRHGVEVYYPEKEGWFLLYWGDYYKNNKEDF